MKKNNWFNKKIEEVEKDLNTNLEKGLTTEEVKKRQEQYGYNQLKAKKKKPMIQRFLDQFKDFSIIVLIIAAIVSGAVGVAEGEGITDTIIILIVVIVNAIIGVTQESKAEKSLEALQKLTDHASKVIRNGEIIVVPAKELVPGDIIVLDTGDYVPADVRIIEAVNLKSQEASLTGESVPVEKNIEIIEDAEVGLGDRLNMLFSSSLITYGRGKGIVVETGMTTEVGKIAGMLELAEEQTTPLQEKLNKLGKTLGIVALAICVFIFIIGLIQGKEPIHMFMTAVSLAVAAIPEGLVAVSTIVLAIGVQKMVKKNAIVKRLPAVETLGSATVICSDKTGTLTQNKMTVEKIFINSQTKDLEEFKKDATNEDIKKLVYANMLCNDTKISNDGTLTGDPTETALVDMAFKLDFDPSIYDRMPRIEEVPFDSDRKLMTTVNEVNGKYIVYTKGGVDELLKRCKTYLENEEIKQDLDNYSEVISKNNEKMAKEALRVLACAYKEIDHKPTKTELENIEEDLTFIGMVGMIDPPREGVKEAVKTCRRAGIKTVMITGDHIQTAKAIAKEIGIFRKGDLAIDGISLDKMSQEELNQNIMRYSVFARVSPENKVQIVKAFRSTGAVVAMTGDGVNDAPALKNADIGIAMGKGGTDVAKNAADMILVDDNFVTIVEAVKQGRNIFDNIKKAIHFLIATNIGEIVAIFVGLLLGIKSPLLAIQLLWINLVTDSFPAIALGLERAETDIMNRLPRNPKKSIFADGLWGKIITEGTMLGMLTLLAFSIGTKKYGVDVGRTMAFLALGLLELIHAFNIKSEESIFKLNIFENKFLVGAFILGAILQIGVVIIGPIAQIFKLVQLNTVQWLYTIVISILPIFIVEIQKKLNSLKHIEIINETVEYSKNK